MKEIKSLKDIMRDYKNDFFILEGLVKAAMLDPEATVRSAAIEGLKEFGGKEYGGVVKRLFNGDNQIFLVMQLPDYSPTTFCVCDIPNEYIGKPTRVYPAILK